MLISVGTFRRHRQRGLNGGNSLKTKTIYDHLKENGDVRLSDSAQKDNLKQGEIDIKALQQKRAQAEFTRFVNLTINLSNNTHILRNRIEEEMRENHPFFGILYTFFIKNTFAKNV